MGNTFDASRDIQLALAILRDREEHNLDLCFLGMFHSIPSLSAAMLGGRSDRGPSADLEELAETFENLSEEDQGRFEEACREIRKFLDPNDRIMGDTVLFAS